MGLKTAASCRQDQFMQFAIITLSDDNKATCSKQFITASVYNQVFVCTQQIWKKSDFCHSWEEILV